MPNYSLGKVYKIINLSNDGLAYVGSTTQPYLSQRFHKHATNYKGWLLHPSKYKNISSYMLFEKYGVRNCKIVLLESVNAESRDQLLMREQYHIDATECVNKVRSFNTIEDNVRRNHAYKKAYDDNNAAKIKLYWEEFRLQNKDRFVCSHCGYQTYATSLFKRHNAGPRHKTSVIKAIENNKYDRTLSSIQIFKLE